MDGKELLEKDFTGKYTLASTLRYLCTSSNMANDTVTFDYTDIDYKEKSFKGTILDGSRLILKLLFNHPALSHPIESSKDWK